MFKFVHTAYYNSSKNQHTGFEIHSTSKVVDEPFIQLLQDLIKDDHPVVVVNAQAELPPYWQTRLLQPMFEDAEIQHISALAIQLYQLSPIISHPIKATLTQLDSVIYLLQTAQYFISTNSNPNCFAVRNVAVLKQNNTTYAVNNLLVDTAPTTEMLLPPESPNIGDQRPLPAHPLAELQIQLEQLKTLPDTSAYPGLDDKPTALHIVMDWGGGVHQWVNDFIHSHDEMHHLVLSSQGEFFRQQQGEQFKLNWQHTEGMQLAAFHLSAPIKITTVQQPQYQQILQSIIRHWDIQLMVVSSLIGHAMDCLGTGLPTLRVLHDYFPHWPSLNAQLDVTQISDADVKQALENSSDEPFGPITLSQLTVWQHTHNQLLEQDNVQIIAPDESVKLNHLKLPHASAFRKTQIIAHATQTIKPINYQANNEPFKVLVLGRISPPKGQQILLQCIQALVDDSSIQFVLLGAGTDSQLFTPFTNTQVIPDYDHAELAEQLQQINPQLALLTSVTAETFSYTLSELLMAGIPVLAHAVGALKTRIKTGKNGLLIKPDAKLLAEHIKALQANPEQLLELHQGALNTQLMTPTQNKMAMAELIDIPDYKQRHYQTQGLLSPQPMVQRLQIEQQAKHQLDSQLKQTAEDLQNKVAWAKELTEQAQHLTHNLELERQEINKLTDTLSAQTAAHKTESNELKQSLNKVKNQLDLVNSELAEALQLRDQLTEEKAQLNQTLHAAQLALEHSQTTIEQIKSSRSWRVTKPLRRFTTYARHKRNALRFRLSQAKGLVKRGLNSLRTRGIKQTAAMTKNKLKKPVVKPTVTAHQVAENYQALSIQSSTKPVVSVIVPVYNHFKHTYHCLESLARLADKTPFEVLVIDDCSTDETPQSIQSISGISYHRQAENGGFIESCNTGAQLAQGQYLVFLNNDTEVLDGWLDELLLTFETQADAGLVGSQLLYPDGRLQEAGGIVFNDASGWNYGRLDSPDAPEYQHLREASYISGASIMISKDLFDALGHFDQRYKPAYYEDTDLAFAVRQVGKKVYYQPHSQVIHFEGVSSGTDLTAGTKKYQVINQQKFLQKWQAELQQQPAPNTDIEIARFQNQPPRVLIFDACTPTPDQDSGSLRMLNLMQIFIDLGYQVSFVPENMAHFDGYTKDLQRLGVECIYAPKYHNAVEYLKAKGQYFETVIVSRYYVAEPLMSVIRSYCPQASLWFDTVDLHYLRETRMAELDQDSQALKTAAITKQKELGIAQACDLTLVVSPYEQQVLAEEKPDLPVAVLSNIHAIHGGHQGYDNSRDIMFIGGYQHTPNVDGILWFVKDIFPIICNQIPDIKLHIIGSKAPQQVSALAAHPNIEFHGFVADIEPFMQNIRVAVAPLRFGAGVKGKVNMSMSYGQPVVGTKVAVEGMYTQHGHDVLMADDANEFAAEVIRIYQDKSLWEQVAQGGLANVQQWFSFAAAKKKVAQLLAKVKRS